jgi:hypothetical protein
MFLKLRIVVCDATIHAISLDKYAAVADTSS